MRPNVGDEVRQLAAQVRLGRQPEQVRFDRVEMTVRALDGGAPEDRLQL
jgi:hypothetical protein